jgi:hypothetical protein
MDLAEVAPVCLELEAVCSYRETSIVLRLLPGYIHMALGAIHLEIGHCLRWRRVIHSHLADIRKLSNSTHTLGPDLKFIYSSISHYFHFEFGLIRFCDFFKLAIVDDQI